MIPQIYEVNFPSYATLLTADASLEDMAEKNISAKLKIDSNISPDFSYNWYVLFDGEKYIHPLRKPQGTKGNEIRPSELTLTFQHWAIYELKRYLFPEMTSTESGTAIPNKYIASLSLTLGDFIIAIAKVLEYYYGDTIKIQLNPDWVYSKEPTNVSISNAKVWNVITQLYELYGVRWQIEPNGTPDKYVIKVGYEAVELSHIFEYGFKGGLLKFEQQPQDDTICNVLLGRGGDKNLPYRYFKDVDPQNPSFPADPDWIPELANIYFSELRDSNFRDYVKGWKTNSRRQLKNADGSPIVPYGKTDPIAVEQYDGGYAATHPAYKAGHEAEKFDPIEYVENKSSIQEYGELWDMLENQEDIYPSIQGYNAGAPIGRVDQSIAVEKILTDDVVDAVENDAVLSNIPQARSSAYYVAANGGKSIITARSGDNVGQGYFKVPAGKTGSVDLGTAGFYGYTARGEDKRDYVIGSITEVHIFRASDNTEVSSTNISGGENGEEYYYTVKFEVENTYSEALNITAVVASPKLLSATPDDKWTNVFDVWIKNVWLSEQKAGESDAAYAERVWRPILGDHVGNDAKLVFSTGWLSISEDYEFVITKLPQVDRSKTYTDEDGNEYVSEWKLTLAKSEADLESTGLYVPSTKRNAEAGDYFFFTGIDLPYLYYVWAEKRLHDFKQDEINKRGNSTPTRVISLDKVRISQKQAGEAVTLLSQLAVGGSLRIADKRFIPDKAYEQAYIQSIKYTFKEPTKDDPATLPDVEVVLSNEYASTSSPISTLSAEVSALQKQIGSMSNIAQLVRMIGDAIYLRKDGISEVSLSPTAFASLLTSTSFRKGLIGGRGWGIYKDENGNVVIEADVFNVRKDMNVNNFVVNQISVMDGKEYASAARMEITRVDKTDEGYVCYYDQKNGSVYHSFEVGDIAVSQRFFFDKTQLSYYKRVVVAITEDSVTLSDSPAQVNGVGVPSAGDIIAHCGSISNPSRRYIKIRDVIGGGYERYIENLDSVNTDGDEYFFVGRISGDSPRFFLGDAGSQYIEWKNSKLTIRGDLAIESTIGGKSIQEILANAGTYVLDLTNEVGAVACNADGVVVGGYPQSTASVWKGSEKIATSQIIFSVEPAGCTAAIAPDGVITVGSMTADTATIKVTATIGDIELVADMMLYKVKPGQQGQDAQVYSIEPSVSNVTLSATGELSTNSITCGKYITTGASPRTLTYAHTLKATIYTDGVAGSEVVIASLGQTSGAVTINANTTAVVFTLYSSADGAILDRERVPVLADASDLEIGERNLIRNSRLNQTLTVPAGASNKTAEWVTTEDFEAEETYTLFLKLNASASDAYLQFFFGGWNFGIQIKDLPIGYEGIVRKTFKFPSGIATKPIIYVQLLNTAGYTATIYLAKLVRGNRCLDWTPAPEDTDYITEAYKQDTLIKGGLIQTSLVKLGTVDESGNQVVRAGVSGIHNPDSGAGGGLAFFAGGDMIDPATAREGQTPSTYGVRMNGTIYAANNTVRINENEMEVGENVILNEDGLILKDGDEDRLRISNTSIGDDENVLAQTSTPISYNSTSTITLAKPAAGGGVSSSAVTVKSGLSKTLILGNISANSVINANVGVTFNYQLPMNNGIKVMSLDGTITIRLLSGTKIVRSWQASLSSTSNGLTHSAFVNINMIVEAEGSYSMQIVLNSTPLAAGSEEQVIATAQAGGAILIGYVNQNVAGNDGFKAVWGNAALFANENCVMMRCGNFGIRVTSAGIGVMKDGSTWTIKDL